MTDDAVARTGVAVLAYLAALYRPPIEVHGQNRECGLCLRNLGDSDGNDLAFHDLDCPYRAAKDLRARNLLEPAFEEHPLAETAAPFDERRARLRATLEAIVVALEAMFFGDLVDMADITPERVIQGCALAAKRALEETGG